MEQPPTKKKYQLEDAWFGHTNQAISIAAQKMWIGVCKTLSQ